MTHRLVDVKARVRVVDADGAVVTGTILARIPVTSEDMHTHAWPAQIWDGTLARPQQQYRSFEVTDFLAAELVGIDHCSGLKERME